MVKGPDCTAGRLLRPALTLHRHNFTMCEKKTGSALVATATVAPASLAEGHMGDAMSSSSPIIAMALTAALTAVGLSWGST